MDNKKVEEENRNVAETFFIIISALLIIIGFYFEEFNDWLGVVSIFAGISSIVFGVICKKVGEAKGLTSGFYIGWFLSLIGLFVMMAMPDDNVNNKQQSNNTSNKYDTIQQLQKLRESGALTEEEFNEEKKKVLNEDN